MQCMLLRQEQSAMKEVKAKGASVPLQHAQLFREVLRVRY